MNRIIKRYIVIVIIILSGGMTVHAGKHNDMVADSLYRVLSEARTPADSVAILCNLYDYLPRSYSTRLGEQVYLTAVKAGDSRTALEIIRNQANRYMSNDSMLRVLMQEAMSLPESTDRTETITFIRMMENMRMARYADRVDREVSLQRFLETFTLNPPKSLYDRIVVLHGLCMMMAQEPNGELLTSYMDSLGVLVDQLPESAYTLRNAYNVHAASVYSGVDPQKSMEADFQTLDNIEHLERYYRDKGRIYRSYGSTYYTVYSRLLSNFKVLTPEQVEKFYTNAKAYTASDPSIKYTDNRFPRPDIYYAMYRKDYAKALGLIRTSLVNMTTGPSKLAMLKYMIECAEALGDEEALLISSTQYARQLEEELAQRAHGTYRELQIAYGVYDMKQRYGEMEIKRKEAVAKMQRLVLIGAVVALVVLIVFVVILFRLYRRNRHLALKLTAANESLRSESENLRKSKDELIRSRDMAQKANDLKSDFIKNMSYEVKVPLQALTEYSRLIADCAGSMGKNHMTRFADLVELNSELLSTIVNDVLRLSEIESSSMPIHAQVVNLKTLCSATVESVRHRLQPGVRLELDASCGRVDLFTDPARVQQILNNLLTNAAKFTPKGCITLTYCEDEVAEKVNFTVTDTGIGINPENKEKIFDRFVKLDRDTQGAGLGLTISRLIARQLGGDLILDTSYRGGARFILTLPKK